MKLIQSKMLGGLHSLHAPFPKGEFPFIFSRGGGDAHRNLTNMSEFVPKLGPKPSKVDLHHFLFWQQALKHAGYDVYEHHRSLKG